MAKNKTSETKADVNAFVDSFVDNEQKKSDSFELIKMMKKWSGYEPKMWGPSIIGFGSYHYQYASGHEGDAPIIGFSPRKPAFSLYVYSSIEEQKKLLANLGKFKMGKYCIYVRKLSDIDLSVLEKLTKSSIKYMRGKIKTYSRD